MILGPSLGPFPPAVTWDLRPMGPRDAGQQLSGGGIIGGSSPVGPGPARDGMGSFYFRKRASIALRCVAFRFVSLRQALLFWEEVGGWGGGAQ